MSLNLVSSEFEINNRLISQNSPVYFVADVAANHDGDLSRAKDLIYLAKEAGAHAAKFQHFKADKIVSDHGFKSMKEKQSHQAAWKKSVYDTYKHYETNREWTQELIATCKKAEIDFMTAPYDFEAIEMFAQFIPAFKIGSGDITWIEAIEKIAAYQKPVLLATGASSMADVERAVEAIIKVNPNIILMQCNTNYTAEFENFKYINLNVIKTYAARWPGIITGLSDHTHGHATVLGAVALGARAIEKHFTDDNSREGPDHKFAMNPQTWRTMVDATRELELAMGDGIKRVEGNEQQTVILQRRCIRLKTDKKSGEKISYDDLEFLRPSTDHSAPPYMFTQFLNKTLKADLVKGAQLQLEDVI